MKTTPMALALLLQLAACVAVAQLPSSVVTDGIGVSDHPYFTDSKLDMEQAVGVKFLRTDITWSDVEQTKGIYDFSSYTALSAECAARGIRMVYVLDYDNSLYDPNGTSLNTSAWRTAFANFAANAAATLEGQGNIYEIWNEPNGGGDPALAVASTYTALVKKAAPAIRGADSTATILAPALSDTNSTARTWLQSCFADGLLGYVDAVSVHPYSAGTPEAVVPDYAAIKSLITQYHPTGSIPIVSSEWGWTTTQVTAQQQGDYLARMFLVNFSQGIPLSCWYCFQDGGNDPTNSEWNYGMVTTNLQAKPAYNELHLLTASLKGETFSQKLNDGDSADWLLVFTGGGHATLTAWTTGTADTAIVPGWGTLHLTSTPFYVNPTLLPGDANLDGTVNVQDLAILAANYRKNVTGGWLQGDFNNDGTVDVQDLALLAANYRQSYASDVVPDYAGFDAAAIQVLSQAGLTVVPEPGAFVLLGAGLLGLLAYAWRKRRQG